ncbi:hypothetical protein [Coleofasciculus sp. E1-EBD-02]|jgi:hypothetical protein|uniref:hypothetical protein n=1 Tax=Coleofasciculus sp. E1-EBD-02 TaxID=3068481 RepID=UPI0033007315
MEEFTERIEDYRTDQAELDEVLNEYDLDAELEREFEALSKALIQLKIQYQSLVNSRRFLTDGAK